MPCSEIHVYTEDNVIFLRCWHSKVTAVYANETELKWTDIQRAQSALPHIGLESFIETSLKWFWVLGFLLFVSSFNLFSVGPSQKWTNTLR